MLDFPGTVIVVSHDRHFLNTVCTHIVDIDYGKIKLYVGNYDFWYESSQLVQALLKNKNKRNQEKIEELQAFIARFAANKSKSKQATSRRKLLDKLTVEQIPCSTRRYPFVGLQPERELGKDVLTVKHISKTVDGVKLLDNIYFTLSRTDKVALVGDNELAQTTLFKILTEELEPDEGSIKWGISTTRSYLPKDNSPYFTGCDMALVDWVRQYSAKKDDVYLPGLFGQDAVLRRGRVQAGECAVRRGAGAVHAVQNDALRGQRGAAGSAHQSPGYGVHSSGEQGADGLPRGGAPGQPRPRAVADGVQPGDCLPAGRHHHRPHGHL